MGIGDESLILANESLILVNESLILADESLNSVNESLILANESLNSVNESLTSTLVSHCSQYAWVKHFYLLFASLAVRKKKDFDKEF
ncbi:hypothetical protein [Nostoc sp.]|uniref:hypothetical protein n=1 Tax=Nostoc sp. TaxID=1180 RepID=UPI002FF5D2D6